MLFRFCLYGFLKNQQYYDAFIILAFRERGLSFTGIGLLVAFREVCINIMEIPTGAIADVCGRRRSMLLSFLSYCISFIIFGLSQRLWMFFAAMFFFAIGEAFRTGTHKALIFDWLEHQNRSHERTRVYGLTRSWSKIGSAVSVVLAAIAVFSTQSFSAIFFFCLIPYTMNIINLLTYPSYLDGLRHNKASIRRVLQTLLSALVDSIRSRKMRGLFAESMSFEGLYKAAKDYLQPALRAAAISLPLFLTYNDTQRSAILVGAVYCVLHLLSSFASRHSHTLMTWAGSEERGATGLWWQYLASFLLLSVGVVGGAKALVIAMFVVLAFLQNFWRPIMVSRIAHQTKTSQMATVLSAQSQSKALFAAIIAPFLGIAVDKASNVSKELRLFPVAAMGVIVCILMIASRRRGKSSPVD